jgi:hypothetical protein
LGAAYSIELKARKFVKLSRRMDADGFLLSGIDDIEQENGDALFF